MINKIINFKLFYLTIGWAENPLVYCDGNDGRIFYLANIKTKII